MSVFGSESRNSISCGRLNGASVFAACARSSSAVAVAPGFSTTKALTSSPFMGCGTPMAAASRTAGWVTRDSSTSRGYTLKPETMIISFFRSTIATYPSSSTVAMSPVYSQPSRSVCAVSSGRW